MFFGTMNDDAVLPLPSAAPPPSLNLAIKYIHKKGRDTFCAQGGL